MALTKLKIGFIGSMNAMPMHYALCFKQDGFDVKYIVDADQHNTLSRPEAHFQHIAYPYPDWIKEMPIRNSMRYYFAFPRLFFREIFAEMQDRDVIFFNDYGLALAKYFPKNVIKIALSSGADLDVSCDFAALNTIANNRYRFLKPLKKWLLKKAITHQRQGFRTCDIISYFKRGLNKKADALLDEIMQGKSYIDIRRMDVNFSQIAGLHYVGAKPTDKLVILSAVRFLIFPEPLNPSEYKGNDIIIRGIAKYYQANPNLEVHFFEKGPAKDLEYAKALCQELGINHIIRWHQTMPLPELLSLYAQADVCFDQVGSHFIGAVGVYALYMGKPLIANMRLDTQPDDSPILQASNAEEIYQQLLKCGDFTFRDKIGKQSHEFAKANFDTTTIYQRYKQAIAQILESR